jgi:hypothetical protein
VVDRIDQEESLTAASGFQRTLMNPLSRQRLSVASLAEHTGYNPNLFGEKRIGTLVGIRDREAELAGVQRLTQSHEDPL